MKILSRQQIEPLIAFSEIVAAIEQGFMAYSKGECVIPPVASLHFESPPGECHIKYGYSKNGKYYVVKIASGFKGNFKLGLPTGNGLMLLFDKHTGKSLAILLDEGYLTELRTAAAGCVAAKYLAPKNISCVGIVGTGAQAFYQLQLLSHATQCRKVMVWGRNDAKVNKFIQHPALSDWNISPAASLDTLTLNCNLIVTTTSSTEPLLFADQIRPGTHITAVGADDSGKQELDPSLFSITDRIIVDSRSQCEKIGDTSYAFKKGILNHDRMIELGQVISQPSLGRTSEEQITIADLTGVAIQDLQIATFIYEKFQNNNHLSK
ncbi:MAG: deaminase [Parachlamydiales bacterium]|jgi:ornithine cyclodeaminase